MNVFINKLISSIELSPFPFSIPCLSNPLKESGQKEKEV